MDAIKKSARNPSHLEWIRKELSKRQISEKEIDRVIEDDSNVPEIAQCEVLIFAWLCIFSFQQTPGWLKATIQSRRGGKTGAGQRPVDFYDESEHVYDRLTGAFERLLEAGAGEDDVLLVMREAQKHAIANLLMHLDGTTRGSSHLHETIYENDEFHAGRRFNNLEDRFIEFDPEISIYEEKG